MKKAFRSISIVVLLAAVVMLLVFYFAMKREVPQHARVIPSDAIGVLTLNLRELALDHADNEHLFSDISGSTIAEKELEPFTRAITSNGASGVEESADILLFAYRLGEEAFFGMAVQLDDSAAFGNLVRLHLAKDYNIQTLSLGGMPVMQFDTTAAVFGWSEDVALLLYPIGNHSIATVSSQCAKLLKQQEQNSVLANENFRAMETKSFSMALWVQTKPLLEMTEGGALIEAITEDVETYSYLADFSDGEMLIRSEWLLADDTKRKMIKEFAFPCDTSLIRSFIRGRFELDADSMPTNSYAANGLMFIPVSDEDSRELHRGMTGDCISIAHSAGYKGKEQTTHCFLLSDPERVKTFITAKMQRDSIPLSASGWSYAAMGDSSWRMIISDELLTITNHPETDGRRHPVTPDLAGYMAWFNLQKIFSDLSGGFSFFSPVTPEAAALFAQHTISCSSTLPVQFGNVRHSEIVLRFRNKEVNALVQLEELIYKSAKMP
jgi:hypothetical protein